jgi:hypothetical protein
MRLILFSLFFAISFTAQGQSQTQAPSLTPEFNDFFELGFSGNYRKVYLTEDNSSERAYDENAAYIASIAYYFREMTAIELSYSEGKNKRYIPSSTITSTTTHRYDMTGLDLVFTFGKRTDTFIPYIKAGAAYFNRKSIEYVYVDNTNNSVLPSTPVEMNSTMVPSAGFGMQVRLTQRLALKTGIDLWTSGPINKSIKDFDWAARLGVSWFL